MKIARRQLLAGTITAPLGSMLMGTTAWAAGERRPKIAALTTVYHKYSHSQHIVDRFLEGYGWEGRHHEPAMDVVSLYVEQKRDDDLSRGREQRYPGLRLYPTIAEALTLGGSELAVDGVLLIGEHGVYPDNKKGQKLYPRYEYFQQVVDVYRRSGRTAPLFNDKHLSWKWEWATEMVETARELGFGFMAGSSVPVARRLPSIDLPRGARVEEIICLRGDFHGLEAMQSIIERRRGGETGVRAVELLRGDRFWKGLEAGSWEAGGFDRRLLDAAISRSNTIVPVRSGYGVVFPTIDDIRRMSPESSAIRFEYLDGTKATQVRFAGRPDDEDNEGGVAHDCTIAARLSGGELFSTLMYLPYYSMRNFFNPQVHHMESLFLTDQSPYPVERTLLTSGMDEMIHELAFRNAQRLETPHLHVEYEPTWESTFWRS